MAKQAHTAISNITPRDGTKQAQSPQSEPEGFTRQTGRGGPVAAKRIRRIRRADGRSNEWRAAPTRLR